MIFKRSAIIGDEDGKNFTYEEVVKQATWRKNDEANGYIEILPLRAYPIILWEKA